MRLLDLLTTWEPSFSVDKAKIHLARNNGNEEPIDLLLDGSFEDWQRWQNKRNFGRKYVVSLVQAGSPTRWLFAGLFRVTGCENEEGAKPHYLYNLERVAGAEEWIGRMFLTSRYKERNSYPNGELLCDDLVVAEVLAERHSVGNFPGYKALNLKKSHLDALVLQKPESWQTALSSVKGIYLITDSATGKLYVGKADGEGGIWGRWCCYAATIHGGNVALAKEFGIDAAQERQLDLKFSILEVADLHSMPSEILARENHWKDVLHTREHGYNRN